VASIERPGCDGGGRDGIGIGVVECGCGLMPTPGMFIGVVDPQGGTAVPDGSTVLKAGNTVILVARRSQLGQAVEFLTAEPSTAASLTPLTQALRKVDFLAPLSDQELVTVARGAEFLQRPAGSEIFKKGDPGESFFVVLAGEVRMLGDGGQVVGTVSQGGFFGELALLTGEPTERVMAQARELGLHFIAAGHYATEKIGVHALGEHIAERFGVRHVFIDVPNPI